MTDGQISPLAPKAFAKLPPIDGAVMAVAEAGIKYQGRKDLLLMAFPQGAAVAGVLTRSKTASAPVDWCREHLVGGFARGLVVNSGNANAFTGKRGHDAVQLTAEQAAQALDCKPEEVFLASTGVIGEPLDASAFGGLLKTMVGEAASSGWQDAAAAIMTTDTFPKVATATAMIDGVPVTLNGIAKGSGMIAPDMATMLSFIVTDAPLSADVLARVLKRSADVSFNAITVDSDTSTSDTVLLFATGEAAKRGAPPITDPADRRLVGFRKALASLSLDLAHQIVRDGEGASKFISVTVEGAGSRRSARTIAMAIANSPLVKTAIAGEDANWGRIVMAVGKSGEPADRDRLAIWFGDIQVAMDGERHPDYSEEAVSALMKHDAIDIRVDLGLGRSRFTAWTCDLTHGYISINADYRS